jgi:hypothetical protein
VQKLLTAKRAKDIREVRQEDPLSLFFASLGGPSWRALVKGSFPWHCGEVAFLFSGRKMRHSATFSIAFDQNRL